LGKGGKMQGEERRKVIDKGGKRDVRGAGKKMEIRSARWWGRKGEGGKKMRMENAKGRDREDEERGRKWKEDGK